MGCECDNDKSQDLLSTISTLETALKNRLLLKTSEEGENNSEILENPNDLLNTDNITDEKLILEVLFKYNNSYFQPACSTGGKQQNKMSVVSVWPSSSQRGHGFGEKSCEHTLKFALKYGTFASKVVHLSLTLHNFGHKCSN